MFCTYGRCGNPAHDHLTYVRDDGLRLDIPVPLTCRHCHLPAHWDERIGDYQHDDPDAPDCFLITRSEVAETFPALAEAGDIAERYVPRQRGRHRA